VPSRSTTGDAKHDNTAPNVTSAWHERELYPSRKSSNVVKREWFYASRRFQRFSRLLGSDQRVEEVVKDIPTGGKNQPTATKR
jgi:hypothetical protein